MQRYSELFVQRRDTFGLQRPHSRLYNRVHRPLTDAVLYQHLRGEVTIGLSSIDATGRTKWTVLDSDRGLQPILEAQDGLSKRGIRSYIEQSRAGGHLWVFWDKLVSSSVARRIIEPSGPGLEVFPSGDIPDEDGLGLLLRAPLGVHRYSGERYPFIHPDGQPVSPGIVRGQIDWLARNVRQVDPTPHAGRLPELPSAGEHVVYERTKMESSPIQQWVEEHDIREVVERYVRVNRSGVGHCPWPEHHKHGDKHPSFQVFEKSDKWWCYTERVGGNSFDFLLAYHRLTPAELLRRLRNGSY